MFQMNQYQGQLQSLQNQLQQLQSNVPQYQQPIPIQAQPIQSPAIQTVTGIEGATAFSIPPNSSVLLMDNNELKVYFKSSDANGMVTLKPYKMIPDETSEGQQTGDYATKNELEAMKQELLDIIEKNSGGKRNYESLVKTNG